MKLLILILFTTFNFINNDTVLGSSQSSDKDKITTLSKTIEETINVESPRYFMIMLEKAVRENDIQFIKNKFDTRHLTGKSKEKISLELASKLKFILDRKLILDVQKHSNSTLGLQHDGEPFYREKVYIFKEKKKELNFYIDRIKSGRVKSTWLISPITIQNIGEFYNEIEGSFLYKYLPPFFFKFRFFEFQLWQIFLIILYFFIAYIFSKFISYFSKYFGFKKLRYANRPQKLIILKKAPNIINIFSFFLIYSILIANLDVSSTQISYKSKIINLLLIFSIFFPTLKLVDLIHEIFVLKNQESQNTKKGKKINTNQAYPFGKGVLKVFISSIFFLIILQNFGVNLNAIFAGLGVGGIAVAFAGQKTMENLIGGLSLIFDRPVKIGEFCKFDDKMGTVEEIGLRSTKIRTLDRTVITIPNAEFSQTKIENLKKRDRIRLYKVIGIRYETSPNQIRFLLIELKKFLLSHPRVDEDPCRIRLTDFNNYSIDVEIYAYVLTDDWSEFLAIREDIYLKIMQIIHKCGTDFAFPSQTVYFTRGSGLDPKKKQEIEEEVKKLKKEEKLFFPEFPEEYKEKILNTIKYPGLD